MKDLLALGCSHTAGVGIETHEIYAKLVADQIGLNLINLARGGGNHQLVQENLTQYLQSHQPAQIILQWPNPYRITTWHNNRPRLENIHNSSDIFQAMLQAGEQNFLQPWTQTIIVCNLLCQARQIPTINILLETVDQYIHDQLTKFNIVLHQDDKQSGRTWFFDSAAADRIHHSAGCHVRWAQRILEILNENTTR
jgi:hypothetical protein